MVINIEQFELLFNIFRYQLRKETDVAQKLILTELFDLLVNVDRKDKYRSAPPLEIYGYLQETALLCMKILPLSCQHSFVQYTSVNKRFLVPK